MDSEHQEPTSVEQTPAPAPTVANNQKFFVTLALCLVAITLAIIFAVFQGVKQERVYDPEYEALKQQVSQKKSALGIPEGESPSLALTSQALIKRISTDTKELASLVSDMQTQLSGKDATIKAKEEALKEAEIGRDTYAKDLVRLTGQLEEARLAGGKTTELEQRFKDAQTLLELTKKEADRLRSELTKAPSSEALKGAFDEVDALEKEKNALKEELKGMVSPEKLARLKKENRTLKLLIQELRADANRSRLFAERADLLSPKALALYTSLTALEGASSEQRLLAYGKIQTELNARVIESVGFATGSSSIDIEKVSVINNNLSSAAPTSEFLIVGYASKSGDAGLNKELSSKRATTVATIADLQSSEEQGVKAVFLGQTDRFSITNEHANQICEIWEIKPLAE